MRQDRTPNVWVRVIAKSNFQKGGANTAQWRKDGTNLPGETNSTLMLNSVMLSDAGEYTVLVTNIAGRATSEVADRLHV